jgi:hypothetical protein
MEVRQPMKPKVLTPRGSVFSLPSAVLAGILTSPATWPTQEVHVTIV